MMYINTNQSDQLIECDYQRLDIIDATNYKTDVLPTGGTESQVYEFRVRAVDSGGLVSENWTETSVTIRVPEQPRVAHRFDGPGRKSTRLNSSHVATSYAVFCLK